ncbi:MAG: ADP-ribosylglycohydrolase family protein [Lentimonas sp.]
MQNAMSGALVADAISMPVHWYYDTDALDRDYPNLTSYQAPRNPHPDSILWRSKYVPRNKDADILHDQAQYWGRRGVHYHQFLSAGGNTLNFLLGIQLYRLVKTAGEYDADVWLQQYVECMRTSGWHSDTYAEEYHRAFFENLASGKRLKNCGISDIHIGGLTAVPFLLAAIDTLGDRDAANDVELVQSHLALTHSGPSVAKAGAAFVEILHALHAGAALREAIAEYGRQWATDGMLDTWSQLEDRVVVGRHLTTACYLPESFTASLYFAWKYHNDFTAGVVANARCGGDNAHRGAVVGALLGAANGVPEQWLRDLESADLLNIELASAVT